MTTDTPIVVPATSIPAQIATLARYIVTAVGGYAMGRGWLDEDTFGLISGLVITAGPMAIGIWATWANGRKLRTLESYAPNSVAVRK